MFGLVLDVKVRWCSLCLYLPICGQGRVWLGFVKSGYIFYVTSFDNNQLGISKMMLHRHSFDSIFFSFFFQLTQKCVRILDSQHMRRLAVVWVMDLTSFVRFQLEENRTRSKQHAVESRDHPRVAERPTHLPMERKPARSAN